MGQLKHRNAIFLSAGVPDASESHFMGEGDPAAISAAISALLFVVLGRRPLVWGGHPAITPMVWAYTEGLGVSYTKWVTLYQSAYFEDDFPDENKRFANVVITEAVDKDPRKSLEIMRYRMLSENSFDSAVFVGGMKGVFEEYKIFSSLAPNARVLPVMSTGGAAKALGQELKSDSAFNDELDYVKLFFKRLGIDPNEKRDHVAPA